MHSASYRGKRVGFIYISDIFNLFCVFAIVGAVGYMPSAQLEYISIMLYMAIIFKAIDKMIRKSRFKTMVIAFRKED